MAGYRNGISERALQQVKRYKLVVFTADSLNEPRNFFALH